MIDIMQWRVVVVDPVCGDRLLDQVYPTKDRATSAAAMFMHEDGFTYRSVRVRVMEVTATGMLPSMERMKKTIKDLRDKLKDLEGR